VTEAIPAPFDRYRTRVRPEWIDSNRHMNMGYYVVVFDLATDAWLDWVGEGDSLRFTTRLLGHDVKRIHYIHEMFHADEGYLAATNELMSLHMSQATRRGAPMAPAILTRLARIQAVHDAMPRLPQVGRVMGLGARPTTK